MNNVNIYLDCSGSWQRDEVKQIENELLNEVNQYDIASNVYYFSTGVYTDIKQALHGGGTEGQPILDHIEATNPENVIIVTDSDIRDCKTSVHVPGFVWMLFKHGDQSKNLIDHLKGSKNKYSSI